MSVNQLEEELRIIKTQKEEYQRQIKQATKDNDQGKLYELTKKVMVLNKEETSILNELNRG